MSEGRISRALWTAEDVAEATAGRLVGADSWIGTGISIDTRSIEPGDIFVALKDARDGHDFVPMAFEKRAAAALVSKLESGEGPRVVVDDTLQGLRDMASFARNRSAAKRIAVTGSVGKTSVKEALALCLSACGQTHAAVKSFNNHIGVPMTLALMPPETAYGVFEVGMNHVGEIAPLAELVRPHAAIVTTIAPVHMEYMKTLEAIANEKADLYGAIESGGAAIVPADSPCAELLLQRAQATRKRIIRFGRNGVEAKLLSYEEDGEGANAEADILGRRIRYRVGAPGAPWANNSLAALSAIAAIGADLDKAAAAFAQLHPPAGRGAAKRITGAQGAFTLVDDAYNASPISVAAALDTLGKREGKRRIAVLGDMLELGPDEATYHSSLAAPIESARVDLVFLAGTRMRALWDALPESRRGGYAETSDALAPQVERAVREGDVVLVKGSLGSKMARVVEALAQLERA